MEFTCLDCNNEFLSKRGLYVHVSKQHGSTVEYKERHGLLKKCKMCNSVLLRKNKSGFCNEHRDRTGENNSFYGKTHSKETVEKLKISSRINSKICWQDPVYREKVITGASKPRHENFSKEQSDRITKWYADNPEQKVVRSVSMTRAWAEGKIPLSKNTSANESKGEVSLREDCAKMFSNCSVEKITIKIGKKWFFPDIVINGTHIVEFYGDYWHVNPTLFKGTDVVKLGKVEDIWKKDYLREEVLRNAGYKVLIVWASEYKTDKQLVLDKIQKWYNEC